MAFKDFAFFFFLTKVLIHSILCFRYFQGIALIDGNFLKTIIVNEKKESYNNNLILITIMMLSDKVYVILILYKIQRIINEYVSLKEL